MDLASLSSTPSLPAGQMNIPGLAGHKRSPWVMGQGVDLPARPAYQSFSRGENFCGLVTSRLGMRSHHVTGHFGSARNQGDPATPPLSRGSGRRRSPAGRPLLLCPGLACCFLCSWAHRTLRCGWVCSDGGQVMPGRPLRVRGQPGRMAGGPTGTVGVSVLAHGGPCLPSHCLEHREQNDLKVIFQVSRWDARWCRWWCLLLGVGRC